MFISAQATAFIRQKLSKVVDVKRLTMLSNTFLVAVLASMMVVAWALPFHQTVLSQDVAEKGSLIEDNEMSGCPDPRDLSYCLYEAIFNDACLRPDKMKLICNDYCNRPC
ncbi:hypothetical protein ACROYT_G022287 [Oculina patagonica]